MDSFHECLQEYGEGLEVVQICLEPEESSIKDEELSASADISCDNCKKEYNLNEHENIILSKNKVEKVNGITEISKSKSEDSLDEDDMTITEDDILHAPRELSIRSKSADRKGRETERCLSKQQSKELSTSDEMVFAVTPTGLERISFEKYWKESDTSKDHLKSSESIKESLNSPEEDTASFYDATTRISVQEQNNSLLYIDHEIDGYETCLDDDSSSIKCTEKNGHKINGDSKIKELDKHNKIATRNKDNDVCAKTINDQNTANAVDEVSSYGYPYVEEHIIKQMKSLRIEPLNINIGSKKLKKKSPTKSSKSERHCVEYYNDQAECLQEIRQKKLEEEEKKSKEEHKRVLAGTITAMEKKMQFKQQEPSEESTDGEIYVPGCHKCFLESYAYKLTKAYIEKVNSCKYCEVIREMLEIPKVKPKRRRSAPALVNLESPGSETEDEDLLAVPTVSRRKSAGPLKFPMLSRRPSHVIPAMTVTVSPDRRDGGSAQRWGPPRRVTLKRRPGGPLGVSIVGGKVDIIATQNGENGEEKAIFGIFIKNVVPNSPAALCGELKTGDRILEVDGVCVRTAQHERAVELIKAAKETVTLTVQSLMTWNTDSSDVDASPAASPPRPVKKSQAPPPPSHEIKITVTEPEVEKEMKNDTKKTDEKETEKLNGEVEKPKVVYSDSESSDEEDERELQGRTYSDKGVEIDRASAGAVKRSREEREADQEEEDDFGYTTNKIKKKYASLGDSIVVVKLERTQKAGLGLSLAGHRDRSRMAVFVCGMNPAGAAANCSPPIKVGDEILEVNGIVLHGRCHLNASVIIKGLVGPVFKIILLRRKSALEDVAVKPLTQFPVALEEVDDRFANYKGVRDITIKKGPSGLGIMIIEGRHTEAGRGIFVSDLQEGSAAEQGGLNIGDMILAVNRDSLLSCTYDAAAAKLKQTDGVVILTVCSPNQKDPADKAESDKNDSTPDGPEGPSRAPTPKPPTPTPVKAEPPPDPATAPIKPNQDTVIEINTNNEVLGIALVGGSDTHMSGPAAVVLEVYKNGVIAKDGRLKVGDQIRDCNGVALNKDMTYERMCMTIKQKAPKLKMTVHRPDPLQYEEVDVELTKKSGRPLGLNCVAPIEGTGAYIGEILAGSPAEVDGKLQRGDFIAAVDGKDLFNAEFVAIGAALKLCKNKTTIKVKRFKIVPR